MKRLLMLMSVLFVSIAFGMDERGVEGEKTMTMEGYIIDTKCATDNKAKLDEFVKTHPKECAMAPDCHKSGYNLYSEGKLWKFDKKSSEKVYDFLKKSDSKLNV